MSVFDREGIPCGPDFRRLRSGTGPSREGDVRPSALVIVTILALAWLALFPLTSVDLHYHLAVGRWILEHRALPDRGIFSATFGHAPWHDQEWGFQVLVAFLGGMETDPSGVRVIPQAGIVRLVVFRATCLALTLAVLAAHMARLGLDPVSRALGTVWVAFLTFGNLFWTVRPQSLSYLALAATLYLLERTRGGDRWPSFALVALMALWANVHGAFVVGLAMIAAEAAGAWIERMGQGGSAAKARGASWRLAASLGAACLNPYGYRQLLHPWRYVLEPEIHRGNVEWTRPDVLHLPLLDLTLVLLVLAVAAGGRLRWGEGLRIASLTGLFLSAIRHLPLVAIGVVPLLLGCLSRVAARGGWRRHLLPTAPGWGSPRARLLAGTCLAAAIVSLSGAKFVTLAPRFEERPVRPMPEASVRFLARAGIHGPGFHSYRFGGFLMYRLYPHAKVFMDGRNDLYGSFRNEVYNPILTTAPGWRSLWRDAVERYGLAWVLLDADAPLSEALRREPGWLPVESSALEPGMALFLSDRPEHRAALSRLTPGQP